MTTMRSKRSPLSFPEVSSVPVQPRFVPDEAVTTALIDALVNRTDWLLDGSLEALERIRTHTEETDRQIEASRAFLADSYRTLEVLRRRNNRD